MAQIMIRHHKNYEAQIKYIRTHGDVLLQRIKMLEIKMNQRKQQNQEASQQDINSLNAMVKKLLQMLAQINTYQYFQFTHEPFNQPYFNQICKNYFESLIRRFITQLRIKRIQRLQRLQHLQSLRRQQQQQQQQQQPVNNFIDPVDFQIWE